MCYDPGAHTRPVNFMDRPVKFMDRPKNSQSDCRVTAQNDRESQYNSEFCMWSLSTAARDCMQNSRESQY